MKIIIVIVFSILLIEPAVAQNQKIDWVSKFEGSSDVSGNFININNKGELITAGVFSDTLWPHVDHGFQKIISRGMEDIVITKFNKNGEISWIKQIGGSGFDMVGSFVLDSLNNIYITGFFSDSISFDDNKSFFKSYGSGDIYILKLDFLGNFIWARQIGGYSLDGGGGISIDRVGNIIVTGSFSGNAYFKSGNDSLFLSSKEFSGFILKLNSNGYLLWAKRIGEQAIGRTVTIDNHNNIYITGYFYYSVKFFPDDKSIVMNSKGSNDIYISKLDSNGSVIWLRQIGGRFADYINDMCLVNNHLYCTGSFMGTVDFDPGSTIKNLKTNEDEYFTDGFVLKLDTASNFVWAKKIGGYWDDYGVAITSDPAQNIYIKSRLNDHYGSSDIALTKFSPSGDTIWIKQYLGIFDDFSSSLLIDMNSNLYSSGCFIGSVSFDEKNSQFNLYSPHGSFYIMKMAQTISSVEKNLLKESLPAFPNPTSDRIIIENPFKTEQNIHIEIYSLEGNLLKEFSSMPQAKLHIDLSDQPQGTYLLKLTSGAESFMAKLNVVR